MDDDKGNRQGDLSLARCGRHVHSLVLLDGWLTKISSRVGSTSGRAWRQVGGLEASRSAQAGRSQFGLAHGR